MIEIIKNLLLGIIKNIDAGNSNISEEESIEIIELLKKYTNSRTPLSKYQAYTYLNISRSKFDSLVKEGILPKGKKIQGFKELRWYKEELKTYLKDIKNART